MPIVPFTPSQGQVKGIARLRQPPDESFALMAAAQMHAEGRLIPTKPDDSKSDDNPWPNPARGMGFFGSSMGIGDYSMPRAGKASDYKVPGVDK